MNAWSVPKQRGIATSAMVAFVLGAGAEAALAEERSASNPIGQAFALFFDSESILLDIVADSLEVRGTYVLLSRTPVEESIPLFYPFPSDSLLGGARMVSLAFHASINSSGPGRWGERPFASGVRWWIPRCRGDTIVAKAVYRQKLNADYARYIATTTRVWGRPLRHASFEIRKHLTEIRLPSRAIPLEFSFPFERHEAGGEGFYTFDAYDFFPEHDIVVRWKR